MYVSSTPAPVDTVHFLDHRSIPWAQVRRTKVWMHQRFHYEYPGQVRNLRQRLVVVPAEQHGHQRLRDYQVHVSVPAAKASAEVDSFGNRVFQFHIPRVDRGIDFEVWSVVEHTPRPEATLLVPPREVARYLAPTPLTTCDATLAATARALAADAASPEALAERLNDWTAAALHYEWGVTHVGTPAAEALALGRGVCQDYAHIMLALCRSAGLPARYVSGHLLGEGGSHAWVEVLVAHRNSYMALAYDPTNHCRVGLSYVTVAVGRDYRDISPTSGVFTAPFQGHLTVSKRVGLTGVEYADGAQVSAS